MKITNFQSIQNVTDLPSLVRYTNMDLNQILAVINGNIDLVDNCSTYVIPVSFAKADFTYAFTHNLGRIPQGYIQISKSGNMAIFDGTTPNSTQQIFLQSSMAGSSGKVLVF